MENTEPDDVGGDVFDDDRVTELQEVLEMSIYVLVWQATERACMHHGDQASPELEILASSVNSRLGGHVGDSRDREFMKSMGHLFS